MKNLLFLLIIFVYSQTAFSQLKAKATCAAFVVDILNGKVNELKPNYTPDEIKNALPCFTSADVGGSAKCGGGVFYKDKDIYFFTERDYVEIGDKFKGQ